MLNASRPHFINYCIALFGIVFMSGTLAASLTTPGADSSPMIQVLGASLGAYSIIALLAMRGAVARIFSAHWLALIPVFFAIASLIWTHDPNVTLRRAGALGMTSAFGFWLAFRFSSRHLFGLVISAAAISVIANFVFIQLNPQRGIHQITDVFTAHHAGSWRGLFDHKNDFGRLMSFLTTILLTGFIVGLGGRRIRWAYLVLVALAALMVVKSNSAQSVVLAAAVPCAVLIALAMRAMTPMARTILLILFVPVGVITYMSAQLAFEYILGLLGRDPSMTGRTDIWAVVITALQDNMILGGGYGVGFDVIAPRIMALTGVEIGHAHNGYLDLVADLGVLGLGLTLVFIFSMAGLTFRRLMHGGSPESSIVGFLLVCFFLIGNIGGSFLLQFNSIYWVLLIAMSTKLREPPTVQFMPQERSGGSSRYGEPSANIS